VEPSRAEDSTTTGIETSVHRPTVVLRDIVTGLLALVLLAGLLGFLGDRSSVVRDTDGERSLEVTFAPVGRNGTGIPWLVSLHDPAGLPAEIQLAIDARYLAIFEHQRFYPEPSEETREGDELLLTFTTEGQETFVLEHDTYLAPRWSPPRAGSVSLVEDGERPLSVSFRTLLVP
jgi:hypothetical protein